MRGESATSPDLMSWVSDLRAAGVRIPDQVAALVRTDRNDLRESALHMQTSESQGANSQVELEPGASTRVAQGLFPPSSSFSFGEAKSSGSVSFVLPLLGTDRDEDDNSATAAAPPPSEGLLRVSRLIAQLCPEAIPASVVLSSRSCRFEELFSDISTPPKEPFAPILFHRIKELLLQSREKFVSAVNAGKAPLALLPFKKHPLAASRIIRALWFGSFRRIGSSFFVSHGNFDLVFFVLGYVLPGQA